jgi:proteasome lid subunit RPN8/RPN11
LVIPRKHSDENVAHAREELPNECCGIVAANDGVAVKVFRARNEFASQARYKIDPRDQIRIWNEIDSEGWSLGAIYHSHPRSAAEPSLTDVNLAEAWPDPVYLIVSLENAEKPRLRVFTIVEGKVNEVELSIT